MGGSFNRKKSLTVLISVYSCKAYSPLKRKLYIVFNYILTINNEASTVYWHCKHLELVCIFHMFAFLFSNGEQISIAVSLQ